MSSVMGTVVGVSLISVGYAFVTEVMSQVDQASKRKQIIETQLNQAFKLANLKVENSTYQVEYVTIKKIKQKSNYIVAYLSYPNSVSLEAIEGCLPLVEAMFCSREAQLKQTKRGLQLVIPRLQCHEGAITDELLNELFRYYQIKNNRDEYLIVNQVVEHPSGVCVHLDVPLGIKVDLLKQAANEIEHRFHKHCQLQQEGMYWSYLLEDFTLDNEIKEVE